MSKTSIDLRPGDKMCTVYAGISPDTGKPMYTTSVDAPLTYTFNEAAEYVDTLNAQKFLGHNDWRVPSIGELNVLFENQAAIGGFEASGSHTDGCYWSSSGWGRYDLLVQRLTDGKQLWKFTGNNASLRCVR